MSLSGKNKASLLDSQTWRGLGASFINTKYSCSNEHALGFDFTTAGPDIRAAELAACGVGLDFG